MTEAEWLASANPSAMLEFLRGKATDRRLRLFAVACCRRVEALIPMRPSRFGPPSADHNCQEALTAAEQFADNGITAKELAAACAAAWATARTRASNMHGGDGFAEISAANCAHVHAGDAAWHASACSRYAVAGSVQYGSEYAVQAELLRDIFGPRPGRVVTIASSVLAWCDGCVAKLAQAIYDEGAFDRLPLLADAVEESGCADTELLTHLRGSGPHTRGCWVVDLLLGKE